MLTKRPVGTCNDDQIRTFKVFEKGKKSHGSKSREYDKCGKMVTFSDFKNCSHVRLYVKELYHEDEHIWKVIVVLKIQITY